VLPALETRIGHISGGIADAGPATSTVPGMSNPAGYSGTPLPAKLGIKPGSRVLLDGAPAGFALVSDADTMHRRPGSGEYDVVLLFAPDAARLRSRWPLLVPRLALAGRLWVCWPKKSSGVATDLGENLIRDYGLGQRLVDVKVAAIDATWSGLAFVRRVKDR
jgi:hypothetical protein